MKILLVIPPAPYMSSDRAFPPLGILYVSSYLKSKKKNVELIDLTGERNWKKIFSKVIAGRKPDFIGFTATTPDMPIVFSLLKIARKILPEARTVLGGAHATISPESCTDFFDSVVAGDGLQASLKAFSLKAPKIASQPLLTDLSKLPLPDRDAVDLEKYSYLLEKRKAANIMTHLGCPYRCVFCCGRKTGYYTKVRFRPVSKVIEEMDFLKEKYGYSAFVFYDDEFNLSRSYAIELCRKLEKRDYLWRAPVRADLLDEELAFRMKKAGCIEVTVGVESGSARILRLSGKKTTPEINSRARAICLKAGIRFKAFTVVGLPFSTEADERLTEKWLLENKPDSADININTPYPSTIEYDEKEKYGIKFNFDFLHQQISYKFDPEKYRGFCHNSFLSPSMMVKIRNEMDARVQKALKRWRKAK